MSGESYEQVLTWITENKPEFTKLRLPLLDARTGQVLPVPRATLQQIGAALADNSTITAILCSGVEMDDHTFVHFLKSLQTNTKITEFDVSQNFLTGAAIVALAVVLRSNTSLLVVRLARQAGDMGKEAETALTEVWKDNKTLTRLDATIKDPHLALVNLRGEQRNSGQFRGNVFEPAPAASVENPLSPPGSGGLVQRRAAAAAARAAGATGLRKIETLLVKGLLVGDSGTGKSCLLYRFTANGFIPAFTPTIGIDFKIKNVDVDGKRIKMQVWDTAGEEQYRTITMAYYRGAHYIMMVYDVTNEQSFNNIQNWNRNIEQHAVNNVIRVLIANKCDDESNKRVVDTARGQALALSLNVPFYEVSAMNAVGVHDAFIEAVRLVKQRVQQDRAQGGPPPGSQPVPKEDPEGSQCNVNCLTCCFPRPRGDGYALLPVNSQDKGAQDKRSRSVVAERAVLRAPQEPPTTMGLRFGSTRPKLTRSFSLLVFFLWMLYGCCLPLVLTIQAASDMTRILPKELTSRQLVMLSDMLEWFAHKVKNPSKEISTEGFLFKTNQPSSPSSLLRVILFFGISILWLAAFAMPLYFLALVQPHTSMSSYLVWSPFLHYWFIWVTFAISFSTSAEVHPSLSYVDELASMHFTIYTKGPEPPGPEEGPALALPMSITSLPIGAGVAVDPAAGSINSGSSSSSSSPGSGLGINSGRSFLPKSSSARVHGPAAQEGSVEVHRSAVDVCIHCCYHLDKYKDRGRTLPAFFVIVVVAIAYGVVSSQSAKLPANVDPQNEGRVLIASVIVLSTIASVLFTAQFETIFSLSINRYLDSLREVTDMLSWERAPSHLFYVDLSIPNNIWAWLELRGFMLTRVSSFFAKVEVVIVYLGLFFTMLLSVLLWWFSEYLATKHHPQSYAVAAVMMGMAVCSYYVVRLFLLAQKFQQIQERQELSVLKQKTAVNATIAADYNDLAQDAVLRLGVIGNIQLDNSEHILRAFEAIPSVFGLQLKRLHRKLLISIILAAIPSFTSYLLKR